MKLRTKKLVCAAVCAGMLFASVPTVTPFNMISITASAAYDVGPYLKKDTSWYSSDEAIAEADEIVKYQLSSGGWRKDMKNTGESGSWAKATIDNNTTWGQTRYLAKVYNATGIEKYKESCLKGFDLLVKMQYDNGGWPQIYQDDGTYHAHITYNDTAMVSVLRVMYDAAYKNGDFAFIDSTRQQQAKNAMDKGIDCILETQIEVNGKLTAWCQQYDEFTMEPCSARAYELPSISSSESVSIVEFLRSLPDKDNNIIRSINAAVNWFDSAKLEGVKWVSQDGDKVLVEDASAPYLWARFYEIETNRPMFSDRDGGVYYDVSEISLERRTGYAWYGTWPKNQLALGTIDELTEEPSTEPPATEPAETISGKLISSLVPETNDYSALWSIDTELNIGDLLYNDRTVTYTYIPDELIGAEAVVTPCDGKKVNGDLANITAAQDITLFTVIDSRVTAIPSWLSDWIVSDEIITNSDGIVYSLYKTDLSAGETVTLGTNGQSTGCTGYTVIAAEAGTNLEKETTIPGDTNCDQSVDVFDTIFLRRHLAKNELLTGIAFEAADVNGDAEVNISDLVLLQSWMLGNDVELFAYASQIETPVASGTFESIDFQFSGDIFIAGDSTVCDYDEAKLQNQNRCGWGMKLGENYNNVNVTNLARSGRSSRSFLSENNYETLCNSIGKGDYLFIQFGHNDEKTDDANRGTYPKLDFSTLDSNGKNSSGQYSFEWIILNKYVKMAQSKGATAVVVTPVTRRSSNGEANFKSHTEYAQGLIEMGVEYNVPVIDMTTLTAELYTELYNTGGADATAEMHCWSDDTQTTIDNTHLSIKGAEIIAGMIADETERLQLKISESLK